MESSLVNELEKRSNTELSSYSKKNSNELLAVGRRRRVGVSARRGNKGHERTAHLHGSTASASLPLGDESGNGCGLRLRLLGNRLGHTSQCSLQRSAIVRSFINNRTGGECVRRRNFKFRKRKRKILGIVWPFLSYF